MTDTIRTRDERRQDRSYQQLELSHLSYVIQWRYDKAREIAGQIELLYVDGAADDIRRTALTGVPPRAENIRVDKLPRKKLVSSSPHPATGVRFRGLT